MTDSRPRIAIIAAFAVIYVVWGSTYLAVAVALSSIPPFLLMGSRSIVGGCILLLAAWMSGQRIGARMWARSAASGVFLFVGCHGTLAYAQQHVPSGLAAILLATIPFWIALLNAIIPGGKRPALRQLGLIVPGFAGVALIVMRQGAADSGPAGSDVMLLVAASMSWAAGTILSERWSPPDSSIAFSGAELVAGGGVLMIIATLLGEFASFHPHLVSAAAFGGWAYLTSAGTIVAFATYTWLLKQVSPTLVATYTFVNPIIAVLLGWAVLGERLNGAMALGAILVIASVTGLLLSRREKAAAPSPRTSGVSEARP